MLCYKNGRTAHLIARGDFWLPNNATIWGTKGLIEVFHLSLFCQESYSRYSDSFELKLACIIGTIVCPAITVDYLLCCLWLDLPTPCPEKNETNNVLGITLTKFNKFSQFLAQFMLTYQLTKKITKKDHHYLYNTK